MAARPGNTEFARLILEIRRTRERESTALLLLRQIVLDADCDHSTEPDQAHRIVSIRSIERARKFLRRAEGR